MTLTVDSSQISTFASSLGDELRRTRKQRGWSRKQLLDHLESQISIQTVATYESGRRQCSVARLVEICQAMDVYAHDLLARVQQRAELDMSDHLVLDLHRIARGCQPELAPLYRWAHQRLAHAEDGTAYAVPLDLAALESMAELCGMTTVDLTRRLRQLAADGPMTGGRDSGCES
jgi:transcriptional regulator with XRE-family HTH domain